MKGNIKKFFNTHKLAICLTAFALSIGSVICAYSISNNQRSSSASEIKNEYNEMLPTIEYISKECATTLAQKTEPELNLEIKDTVPIYNVTNNIVGYSVSYYKGDTPYGYASFDFTTNELITDFVINKDTKSMYDVLSTSFAESNSKVNLEDCTNKLYNTTGIDYAVSANTNSRSGELFYYNASTYDSDDFDAMLDYYEHFYLDFYNNTEYEDNFYYELANEESDKDYLIQGNISEWFKKWIKKLFPNYFTDNDDDFVAPTAYPSHNEVFKNLDQLVGEISEPVMLPQYSREKSLTSQYTIMTTTNRYACGLVALTSICNQEDILLNGNIQDTFNKLWDLTGTQNNIYETGTHYGHTVECSGTSIYQMAQGMKKYGDEVGAVINTSSQYRPDFALFKNAVDNKLSSVLCYQIENQGGHGVSILGYAFGTISNHPINYLLAADGWFDDTPRYVLYNPALFQETTSVVYDITKKENNDVNPTIEPTIAPSDEPGEKPDVEPTVTPSDEPNENPNDGPTVAPSDAPGDNPTVEPSSEPSTTPNE